MRAPRPAAPVVAATATSVAVLLVGCSASDPSPGAGSTVGGNGTLPSAHVHAVAIDPSDGALLLGTHEGLVADHEAGELVGRDVITQLARPSAGRNKVDDETWSAPVGVAVSCGPRPEPDSRHPCEDDAMSGRILIVEDDSTIGEALTSSLRDHAYDVEWEQTGAGALARAATGAIDLVLLDLGLPDLDGVEVCRQLRRTQPGCVLVMLTARSAVRDVVVGLNAGADDYLVKPVPLPEFHARIRAHLRRIQAEPSAPAVLTVGDLVVDLARHRVTVAGRELRLRPKEFDLLARLAAQPEVAHSRKQLMSEVWDPHWFGSTKTLDVHVAVLRRKLRENAAAGDRIPRIVTVRAHGFRLELPAPDDGGPR